MTQTLGLPHLEIRIFTPPWKLLWLSTFLLVLAVELTPFHSEFIPASVFYLYKFTKGMSFLLLGWETPLAFRTSNPLSRALLVSCGTAALVEVLQSFTVGHRFSIWELLVKLVIISFGFVAGLMTVYDRKIAFIHLKY